MSRARKIILILLGIALIASACAKHLDRGVVVGKDHTPEQIVMMPQYTTMCSGNPPICNQVLIGMIPMDFPEGWTLHLQDGQDKGDHDVNESDYNKYQIGSVYP